MAYGNLRFQHVQRARFVFKTSVSCGVKVFRDKAPESGVRVSKLVIVPAESISLGRKPMEWLWSLWHECCKQSGGLTYGLIRDFTPGRALSIKQFQEAVQSVCIEAKAVTESDAKKISSYGFRRVQATAADIWGASWALTVALGCRRRDNGASASSLGDGPNVGDSLMPITYAGRLTDSEAFAKAMMLRIIRAACMGNGKQDSHVLRWEAIRTFAQNKKILRKLARDLALDMEDKFIVFAAFADKEEAEADHRSFAIPDIFPGVLSSSEAIGVEFDEGAAPTSLVESGGVRSDIEGPSSSDSSREEVGDNVEKDNIALCWLTPGRGGKIHLASGKDPAVAKCEEARGRFFRDAFGGEHLAEAMGCDKPICDKCFSSLDSGVRDKVCNLMVPRVEHNVLSDSEGVSSEVGAVGRSS